MEAILFIKDNDNDSCFASNYFESNKAALDFVQKMYKLGAVEVLVDEIYDEAWRIKEEGGPYSATLVVTLPSDVILRSELKEFILEHSPDELDGIKNNKLIKRWNWDEIDQVRLWWD